MIFAETDHPGYIKNTETGVIINTNEDEYQKFLAAREASKKNNNLCKRMSELEHELRDIKGLLQQLVHRNN